MAQLQIEEQVKAYLPNRRCKQTCAAGVWFSSTTALTD